MGEEQVQQSNRTVVQGRRHCLVDGCACGDARIVSRRRAAFFAAVARDQGETATRVVEVDPSWSIAALVATQAVELS